MNEYDKERFDEAVPEVKSLIEQKEFDRAKSMLDEFALNDYAKWCFIYAEMRYAQGWMNEAYRYYKRAYKLDRYNTEYSEAFGKIYKMKHPEVRKQRFKEIFGYSCASVSGCLLVEGIACNIACYNAFKDCDDDCAECFGCCIDLG